MNSPVAAVKAHPKLFAGVAIGALVLVVILRAGSAQAVNSGTAAPDASTVESANQLQGMLAGIQGQVQQSQIAADAQAAHDASSLEALKIQANTTNAANTIAGQIAALQINKEAETTQQYNSLQAKVIENQANVDLQKAAVASQTTIQTTQAFINGMVQQGQQTVQIAGIQADTTKYVASQQASSNVGVAQASRPCSSYLFGLISSC